jgi:hypothetical protein
LEKILIRRDLTVTHLDPEKTNAISYRELVGNWWVDQRRFKQRVRIDEATGCHIWTGVLHKQGYGFVNVYEKDTLKRSMATTHRIALMTKLKKTILPHDYVLHSCGNPSCVNPDHLYIGDHYDMVRLRMEREGKKP